LFMMDPCGQFSEDDIVPFAPPAQGNGDLGR
jgi:hypothetical protein